MRLFSWRQKWISPLTSFLSKLHLFFQVLDNKLLSNMAAFWELMESGRGSVIKVQYGLLGTVPQCHCFIMKAYSFTISLFHTVLPFEQLRALHTEAVCFTLNRPEFISLDSPLCSCDRGTKKRKWTKEGKRCSTGLDDEEVRANVCLCFRPTGRSEWI